MATFATPRNNANELDVLLEDLSRARYAGGPKSYEKNSESSTMYSTSIVQQLNGYHPSDQIVEPVHMKPQKESVIRELESLTTEEETYIEETKQYRLNFGNDWDKRSPRTSKKPLTSTTTVYAEVNPQTPYIESNQQHINELTHNLFWHKLREKQVDMPLPMDTPTIAQKIHEPFEKPGIRTAQSDPNYRVRFGMEEIGRVEEEEVETTWIMPEVPEEPPRKYPNCAACTKQIQGRCITAMMRKFHPEHFVCSYCLKQLNKGTFKEREDKPYCQDCFYRLFG